jgi:hypothetical protein
MHDYKLRTINARKGKFDFKRTKIPIKSTSKIPVVIISNSLFLYFFVVLLITGVCSILIWPVTWITLWEVKWKIIVIVVSFLINWIVKKIVYKWTYSFTKVKRRMLLGFFDFVLLIIAIFGGIVSSLLRFITLFVILIITIIRIDINAFPHWIARFLGYDGFSEAYYGNILIQHEHNHPVLITFYHILYSTANPVNSIDDLEEEEKDKQNKKKIIRNKFHLLLFLSRNPSLIKYRSHNLNNEVNIDGGHNEEEKEDNEISEKD